MSEPVYVELVEVQGGGLWLLREQNGKQLPARKIKTLIEIEPDPPMTISESDVKNENT